MANASEKAFVVLEWFFSNPNADGSLKEISRSTGIPPASLLRILKAMVKRGYLRKNIDKTYHSLFSISFSNKLAPASISLIERIMHNLLGECKQSVELLAVRNQNLYWLRKFDTPELPLKIKAYEGFSRTLYELDAPSKLYLNFIGIDSVKKQFDIESFYTQEAGRLPCKWRDAKRFIADANSNDIIFDRAGNGNSVRRYAALLQFGESMETYLLTIAEPALESTNSDKHFEKQISLLINAKNEIIRRIVI